MNISTHKTSETSSGNLFNVNNVLFRKKVTAGPKRSLENIFIFEKLGNSPSEKNAKINNSRKALLDAKRRSRSENELNIQEDILEVDRLNEFNEKTGDLLVKALKHNKIFEKTESENEQDNSENYHTLNDKDSPENMMMPMPPPQPGVVTDSQGLIVPKKLINPCLESSDRQNLHRELLFNQKIGKNVLNQKSELQRALEKQKERQFLIHQQHQQERESGLKSELNRVIMERQQKIEKKNLHHDEIDSQLNPEYLNARAKLRARVDAK